MENLRKQLMDELAKQLCQAAKEMIAENTPDWEDAGDNTPEWVSQVFSAARDLIEAGAEMEAAEVIAAICDGAKNKSSHTQLRVLSTSIFLLQNNGFSRNSLATICSN